MKRTVLMCILASVITALGFRALGQPQPSTFHEYKVISEAPSIAERRLNALAKDGWRLIALTPHEGQPFEVYFFLEK